jgi:hypothetical protein
MIMQPIAVTASTLTLNKKTHGNALIVANRAAGITFTLPASSGSGLRFRFYTQTTITSNNLIIQVANSTDILSGQAIMATDNASDVVVSFETGASDDTITMNGTTKGGIKGDQIEIEDVASGIWAIKAFLSGTGTEVTPFSSAV